MFDGTIIATESSTCREGSGEFKDSLHRRFMRGRGEFALSVYFEIQGRKA